MRCSSVFLTFVSPCVTSTMIFVTNKMQQNYIFIDSFKSTLHVSGDSFSHFQEHFDCVYSILEQYIDALFQNAVNTVKVLPKMGETVARNMASRLKRIDKNVTLLHLVGYGYHWSSVCLYNWTKTVGWVPLNWLHLFKNCNIFLSHSAICLTDFIRDIFIATSLCRNLVVQSHYNTKSIQLWIRKTN